MDVQIASLFWKHVVQGKLQQVKQHTEQQLSQEYAALCTVAYTFNVTLPLPHHVNSGILYTGTMTLHHHLVAYVNSCIVISVLHLSGLPLPHLHSCTITVG